MSETSSSRGSSRMNTRIFYQYRDAGNNKIFYDVVIRGGLTKNQIDKIESILASFPEQGFLPEKIGIPVLTGKFFSAGGFDQELDHDWHEWLGAEATDAASNVDITSDGLLENIEAISREGWDAIDAPLVKDK